MEIVLNGDKIHKGVQFSHKIMKYLRIFLLPLFSVWYCMQAGFQIAFEIKTLEKPARQSRMLKSDTQAILSTGHRMKASNPNKTQLRKLKKD